MSISPETTTDDAPSLRSVLVLDRSDTAATAHLFDLVEGAPRFVAAAYGPAATELSALLRELEGGAARRLLDAGVLISPQRADGDGVDHVFHIVDREDLEPARTAGEPFPAQSEPVDRELAGRTALDVLATQLGLVLLAIDFDLDLARSTVTDLEHLGAGERDYMAIREAVSGFRDQLAANGGRATVNMLDIGPNLLDAPVESATLAIIDGCGLQPGSGMITVATDREGLLVPLGAIAVSDPAYAVAIFEKDFLSPLGSYLAVEMPEVELPGAGDLTGTLRLEESEPPCHLRQTATGLHRLRLERGAAAELAFELSAGARFGAASNGETIRLNAPGELTGGPLGIIIDTRRPDADNAIEPETLARWLDDLRDE